MKAPAVECRHHQATIKCSFIKKTILKRAVSFFLFLGKAKQEARSGDELLYELTVRNAQTLGYGRCCGSSRSLIKPIKDIPVVKNVLK